MITGMGGEMTSFLMYPYFKKDLIIQGSPATRIAPVLFSSFYLYEPEKSKKIF
jgi:hypothetical protein